MCYEVLTYAVDGVINFKIFLGLTFRSTLRFFLGEKEGKTKIQKLEYLENKKSSFLKGYHLVINKNLLKNIGCKL